MTADKVSFATRGLGAVHVLAAHCTDTVLLCAAVHKAGVDVLARTGGYYTSGELAARTPM
eukprot:COSAG01_NODE_71499_length_255_cov_2.000000_1_plen_59_part_10